MRLFLIFSKQTQALIKSVFQTYRNPRVSCRGGLIPQMDLRAWKETEVKPSTFHAATPEEFLMGSSPTSNHHYQDTDEYEAEEGSAARGSGSPMPIPEPEDDWTEELPKPLFQGENSALFNQRRKLRREKEKSTRLEKNQQLNGL